ncbi:MULTISPECIES: type VI secretion system TssO [Bacteroidaceae]|uniref:Type VI secretion system transmembrane protein TssO n=1 Tax=Phocaeicola barnesiae TaxID=376804 RepID=A0AAW5NAW4_9BACT|nr:MULTISPECIES: type VI secretion system TssO [Bacteroidaceae]MBM6671797.1 hypothetical protein [Phocaeicola coprophilus]MBM6720245.1 hypothetical protein [Bacteroides gallinaceum]MBM6781681.1 hypothetical protein [Bacteroides mediterraneensis]MCR8875184.1 type VI secretion system transmembrane protein TssO [Phocaeicola barnesiae]
MTRDETIWTNIRFTLLLVFSVAVIFILLVKYVFDVPMEESSDLIKDINHSETVFEQQKELAEKAAIVWSEVDSLDFNVYQVQRMDEIKGEISSLRDIYIKNNMNSKFFFSVLSSRTLKFQFDIREELNSVIHNNELIEEDLEECKANL